MVGEIDNRQIQIQFWLLQTRLTRLATIRCRGTIAEAIGGALEIWELAVRKSENAGVVATPAHPRPVVL
jgi:hypothetical protein